MRSYVDKGTKFLSGNNFTGWHVSPGDICNVGKRTSKQVIIMSMGIRRALVKSQLGKESYVEYSLLTPINRDKPDIKWPEVERIFDDIRKDLAGITSIETAKGLIEVKDVATVPLFVHFGRKVLGQYIYGAITLAVEGVQVFSEKVIRSTILHEFAHAMLPREGHSPSWKAVDKALGGSGSPFAEESIDQHIDPVIKKNWNDWSALPADRKDDKRDRLINHTITAKLIKGIHYAQNYLPFL